MLLAWQVLCRHIEAARLWYTTSTPNGKNEQACNWFSRNPTKVAHMQVGKLSRGEEAHCVALQGDLKLIDNEVLF